MNEGDEAGEATSTPFLEHEYSRTEIVVNEHYHTGHG